MPRVIAYLLCRVFELVVAMATVQLAVGLGKLVWTGVPPEGP